jgi:hypothetical protein
MVMPAGLKKSIKDQARNVLVTGQRFKSFNQMRQRHFWSTYYFTPDANGYIAANPNLQVFVTPAGQNGQGFPSGVTLGDKETNWKSQNRVPDNQNFEITEIGVSLIPVTQDVVAVGTNQPILSSISPRMANQFLNNTIVQITYLTNSVPLGLAADFAQAAGPQGGSKVSVSANYSQTNGFAAPALRRRFKVPILLQHGEVFSFGFNIPRSYYVGILASGAGVSPFTARFDFWATESYVE